ncbi:hypothetical protein CkaCkLH20_10415 [Colletotrichum karsti]|uniref:Uncharacterized protein n=1 Tax=Colletotrichum karsti TaxID=1095194 RepID=A0A9P6HVE4_9PEZI|nr:uncharacterized protein CkaCkLH20_10415 [Colletotrichum karsti]KAF9872078.1 hypothetical protein CkaCkLH20_10415 [Colletotrichum karsti]
MSANSTDSYTELQTLRSPGSSTRSPCHDSTLACRLSETEGLVRNRNSYQDEVDVSGDDDGVTDIDRDANFDTCSETGSQGEIFHEVSLNEQGARGDVVHGDAICEDFTYERHEVDETVPESSVEDTAPPGDKNEPAAHLDPGSTEAPTWRPTWLRVEALVTFTGIFLAITIAVPILLWYSERNNGITESRETFVYVWRFGPTAVLTLIAAFWGRVELQAMRYTPYIILNAHRESLSEKDYTLDYMSMSFPNVIIHSIRRKHHLVYLTAIVSLLLKAQIALISGLLSLADNPHSKVDVRVLDSFNSSANVPATPHGNVFYIAQGIQHYDLNYPFGVTESIAYQTFELEDGRAGRLRGSIDAPLKLLVDGFQSEFQCLKLENYSGTLSMDVDDDDGLVFATIDMDLHFGGCGSVLRGYAATMFEEGLVRTRFMDQKNVRTKSQACPELPQQDKQFMIITGIAERSEDSSSAKLTSAAGVICSLSS